MLRHATASWRRLDRTGKLRATGVISAMVVVGATALALAGPGAPAVAIPGPLSSFHSPLREDCVSCHVAAPSAIATPWHGMSSSPLLLEQSRKCLHCHRDLAPAPLQPHGWSAEARLLASDRPLKSRTTAPSRAAFSGVPMSPDDQLACSTCHEEHRGRDVPLAGLSDVQCQACHAESFDGLAGHPAFDGYPYSRRTGVTFDHAAHIDRHFPEAREADVPTSCATCHAVDAAGEHMLTKRFDPMCSSCHDEEIGGAHQIDGPGLPVLALPAMDVEALAEAAVPLGAWPADAALVETDLTPIMALLLEGDPSFRAARETLDGADLLDLLDASDDELAAAATIALSCKRLLLELRQDGHSALARRLPHPLRDREARAKDLAGLLPHDLVAVALESWLPGLEDELGPDGVPAPAELPDDIGDLDGDPGRAAWVSSGGWFRSDGDFTLRYRTVGHADSFMRAWLDLACALQSSDVTIAATDLFSDLTDPRSTGHCTKCHAVEEGVDGDVRIAWNTAASGHGPHGVTRFVHATHFPALREDGCLTCHVTQGAGGESGRARASASGFAPMAPEDCARCHEPESARADCLTCHVYHARGATRTTPDGPLRSATSPTKTP